MTLTGTALQTRYAGCRFRSRLEARWAVFFDTIGLQWDYEPQGYLINHLAGEIWTGPYLPDFYFPRLGTHGEVKGDPTPTDVRKAVAAAIPHGGIGGGFLLLGPFSTNAYAFEWLEFEKGDVYWRGLIVGSDSGCYSEEVASKLLAAWATPQNVIDPTILTAIAAARSARFEHGERG